MDNSLVSIIVPVYNVRLYLEEALNSCLAQTYRNLEIILVDDGSTDGSGQICDEYVQRDTRFKVIHQANSGVSAARNAGLAVMTGRYVMFLDPDDAYLPEMVKHLSEALIREQADIALCRFQKCCAEGKMSPSFDKKDQILFPSIEAGVYDRNQSLRALVEKKRINQAVWNKIFRRELFDQYRFPNWCILEDMHATYSLVKHAERIVVINEMLYLHRIRIGSITQTMFEAKIRDRIKAYSYRESFVIENMPETFQPYHLNKARTGGMKSLMELYCLSCQHRDTIGNEVKQELRREIIKYRGKVDLSEFGIRFRTKYYLLRYCPKLLSVIYR